MRFSVALICMMVVASGCGPSEREKFEATEKLLSAWDSGVVADHSMQDYIRELISVGADVNARSTDGWTPLMFAARKSTPEIVQLLLEEGAELEARGREGWTPLLHAAWISSTPEIVQLLLEKGADVNARGIIGRTPLMLAARISSTPEIVQLLLEKGADVNARTTGGMTPLQWAGANLGGKGPEMKQLLIDAGAKE